MVLIRDVMTKNPVVVSPDDRVTKARSIIRQYGYRALPVLENNKLVGMVSRGDILRITSTRADIQIEGIMNKEPITVGPEIDLPKATREIIKHGVRQLPVVDGPELLGIVSSVDLLNGFVRHKYKPAAKKISDVMSTKVVHCRPDDELSHVWNSMLASGFAGMPVVDNKKVVGMITRMDIIRKGSARLSLESGRTKSVLVKKVMKTPAITTTPDAEISVVAEIMLKNKIIRLPVVDNKHKLLGIVDIEDVLRAYIS